MQWARQFPKHLGIRFKKWRWLHNMKSWEEIKVWGGKWTSYEYLIRTPWTWKCSSKEYMEAVTRDETWLYVHEFLYFVPGSLFERVMPAEIDVSNWENHRTLLQCWIFFCVFCWFFAWILLRESAVSDALTVNKGAVIRAEAADEWNYSIWFLFF